MIARLLHKMAKINSNDSNAIISPLQCKLARTALGIGLRELGKLLEMSPNTISRLERGEELQERTLSSIRGAFERSGIEFIPENGGGEGVRLAKPKK